MLSTKLKLVCGLAMLFGCLSVASAHYDTRCCCGDGYYKGDAYSKFNTCYIPEYPQQYFPRPSP